MPNTLIEALPLVTTPLSLVAFLAAVAVLVHARAVARAESLIKLAPAGERSTLVGGALEILDVKTTNLTREQRYDLALQILAHRRFRGLLTFWVSLAAATILAGLAAYSFTVEDLNKDVEKLLAEENRPTAMAALNSHGIYEAADTDMVEYLAEQTALPQEPSATDIAYIQDAQRRYEAIPSVRELRRLAQIREHPFTVLGEQIRATTPERKDQPLQYFAHVPMGSTLSNRPVKVTSLQTNRNIRVWARPAIDPTNTGTGMHLNSEQATYLNGGAFPAPGELDVVVRETVEPISDDGCSTVERPPKYSHLAHELCEEAGSPTISYLQSVLQRL